MRGSLTGRTALVVMVGLLLGGLGLRLRDRLWSQGEGDYARGLGDAGPAEPSLVVDVQDAESGAPLAGARVSLDDGAASSGVTAADGRAALRGFAEGEHTLRVEVPGYARALRRVRLEGPIPAAGFRLQRAVRLAGSVVGDDGQPVPDAKVAVRRLDWQGLLLEEGVTDASGRFAFDALQERSVEVTARAPRGQGRAFVRLPREDARVVLQPGELRELTLGGRRAHEVSPLPEQHLPGPRRVVKVLAPDGKPLSGARVYSVPADAEAALALFRSGEAELLGHADPGGELEVRRELGGCLVAGAWPYAPSPLQPCVSTEDEGAAELRLVEGGWLSGAAVMQRQAPSAERGDGGAPLEGYLIVEKPEGTRAATDKDGNFRLGPLSPGTHELELWAPDGALELRSKKLELLPGQELRVDFAR